jgi:hypothetical protein
MAEETRSLSARGSINVAEIRNQMFALRSFRRAYR